MLGLHRKPLLQTNAENKGKLGDRPPTATLNELACILMENQMWSQAEALFRQSLSEWRLGRRMTQLQPISAEVLRSLQGLTVSLRALGRFREAKVLMNRLLRENEAQLGCEHPLTLSAVGAFAQILIELDELDQAEKWLQKAITSVASNSSPDSLYGVLTEKLGAISTKKGDFCGATMHFQNAVDAHRTSLGESDAQTLQAYEKLAAAWEIWRTQQRTVPLVVDISCLLSTVDATFSMLSRADWASHLESGTTTYRLVKQMFNF